MKNFISLSQYTSIGGQAVIEGVMMRSPKYIAIAVRKPNQKIVIRSYPYSSFSKRFPLLRKPVFRGVAMLIESLFQGIDALSYSANIAADSEKTGEELSNWAIIGSILTAFILGMGLFVALPHFLTAVITGNPHIGLTAQSPIFHLLDGALKITILLIYVYSISCMKDIHRVFQYHGAEHKSIYTFEKGEELIVENARKHTTLHPRCGTSFLLFLVLISIAVFSVVFPLFHLTDFSSNSVLNHIVMILIKIVLMLPVAGLAYEFIKMCAFRMDNPLFRTLIFPGMLLQKLTTREPSDEQLEIALASLKQVLGLEKGIISHNTPESKKDFELEIAQLSELGRVQARVSEFPEV